MIVENDNFLGDLLSEKLPSASKEVISDIARLAGEEVSKKEKVAFSRGLLSAVKLVMPSAYAVIVLLLFSIGNLCVWYLVYTISLSELKLSESGRVFTRLITSDVLNTLIIATASQTALAFMTIITFMYGRKYITKDMNSSVPEGV